jgi:hypothetical protein
MTDLPKVKIKKEKKMRKLNLIDYTVKMKVPDKLNPGLEMGAEFPFSMKDSLINVLFIPQLRLNSVELLKANVLGQKILACEGDEMLLEDTEWQRLSAAIQAAQGFGRMEIEFCQRINEAEVVEVEQK